MNDIIPPVPEDQNAEHTPPPPPSEPPPPPTPEAPVIPVDEIEEGKTFAILSYALSFIGLPFWLLPIIIRDNDFSLYHAKQCLILWLAGIALGVIATVTMVIFCLGAILGTIGGIALLILNILGLIHAINGRTEPLPLIGIYAHEWFKGLTKVPKA